MNTTIVSPIAREMPTMNAADIPESAAGKTTRSDVVTTAAEAVARFAQLIWNRPHGVLRDGSDDRHGQDPDSQTGGKQRRKPDRVVERLQHLRGDEAQCEQAEHHRRDACQRLNDRLDDLTQTCADGVLGEVERNTQSHWAANAIAMPVIQSVPMKRVHTSKIPTRKPANPLQARPAEVLRAEELRCLAEDVPHDEHTHHDGREPQ